MGRLATTLAIMKSSVLTAALLSLPSLSQSQTLCRPGEIDYFSCETVAIGKRISVCGNIADGDISSESWLQYRFGKVGAIELAYPTEKQGSVKKFEGNYFNKYGVADLRFISGRTLYGVELSEMYNGDDAPPRSHPAGGVNVQMGKVKYINISCRRVNTSKYFNIYTDLNTLLRAYNGETDFLFHFHNHVSK